jgi:hypothetical protein
MRPKSSKHVPRAVMLRADTMQLMMSMIARMESDMQMRTGIVIGIPYATLLDSLVREAARRLRIPVPGARPPSLDPKEGGTSR